MFWYSCHQFFWFRGKRLLLFCISLLINKSWNYSSIILSSFWGICTWVFPSSATLYFHSTTFRRWILYFLFHYIYLITLVTSYFTDYILHQSQQSIKINNVSPIPYKSTVSTQYLYSSILTDVNIWRVVYVFSRNFSGLINFSPKSKMPIKELHNQNQDTLTAHSSGRTEHRSHRCRGRLQTEASVKYPRTPETGRPLKQSDHSRSVFTR